MGIGNLVMSDDGIGVRVIQYLQEHFLFPHHVTLMDGGTLGLDLLPKLEGVEKLLLVDAVETGQPPGSVSRLNGEDIPRTLETKLSPHQMGLKDLLSVAALIGSIPADIVLWGIQPETTEMGTELSPAVAAQLVQLANQVLLELSRWEVKAVPA